MQAGNRSLVEKTPRGAAIRVAARYRRHAERDEEARHGAEGQCQGRPHCAAPAPRPLGGSQRCENALVAAKVLLFFAGGWGVNISFAVFVRKKQRAINS